MPLFLSAIITSKLYLQKLLSKMLGHFCFFVMKQKKRRKNALHFQYISKLFFLSFGYFNPPTQMFGKLKFWKRTFKEQGFFFFFCQKSNKWWSEHLGFFISDAFHENRTSIKETGMMYVRVSKPSFGEYAAYLVLVFVCSSNSQITHNEHMHALIFSFCCEKRVH